MTAPIRFRQLCTFGILPRPPGSISGSSLDFNISGKRQRYDTGSALLTSEKRRFSEVRWIRQNRCRNNRGSRSQLLDFDNVSFAPQDKICGESDVRKIQDSMFSIT